MAFDSIYKNKTLGEYVLLDKDIKCIVISFDIKLFKKIIQLSGLLVYRLNSRRIYYTINVNYYKSLLLLLPNRHCK